MSSMSINAAQRAAPSAAIIAQSLLQEGSRGPQVADLQRKLAAAGFNPGAADGVFGAKTKAAVVAFQRSRGLVADGIAGPKTLAALNAAPPSGGGQPVLKNGSRGPAVADLQHKLAAHGFNPGSADGVFGPRTQAAVKDFQRAHGLAADGIVGPKTWAALNGTPQPRPPTPGGPTGPVTPPTGGGGNFAKSVVGIAQGELAKGIAETPPGSNRQPYSKFWGRPPEPWCADFVSYVCRQAGNKDINFASVDMLLNHLKKTGQFHKTNPQAGDIIIFDWNRNDNDPSNHTGIVESVYQKDGKTYVNTIEGNSGDRVARRTYALNDPDIVGFGTVSGTGGGVTGPGTPPPSGGGVRPTLRQGSSGPDVADLQRRLNELGFSAGTADGDFGPKTLAAVKAFQQSRGLAADGIVGQKTWAALGITAPRPPDPGTGDGVSLQQLREIMPNLSDARAREVLPHLNKAMAEGGINTPKRQAAFLAQLAHESMEFKHFEEIASGEKYEGRKDLGNIHPGDGKRFKGRGPIQLTGRANYREAGKALGIDLENNPKRAADVDVGFRTAVWFWNSRNLNQYADEGDFKTITRRINGGENGMASRQKYYDRAKHVLSR